MINAAIAVTALAVLAGAGAKRMPRSEELVYQKKTALGICIALFSVASVMFLIGIIKQIPH